MENMKSWGVGQVIAVVVIALSIVLMVIGRMTPLEGGLFCALGVARLT